MNVSRRADRNGKENKDQILEKYYFPQITKLFKKYTNSCEICRCNKYDRNPQKPKLQATPIPLYLRQLKWKFSKFVKFFRMRNESVLHIRDKLIKLLHNFTVP